MALSFLFRPDFIVIIFYILLLLYFSIANNKKNLGFMGVSSLLSLFWMLIAKKQYGYNTRMQTILGINLFPLFAWAIGLFLSYLIYRKINDRLNQNSFLGKFLVYSIPYWILLISAETIAYHLFNLHNLATAGYAGIPLCDCLHAPLAMQISYFLLGPAYFLLTVVLEKPMLN
jgi:hypothetical protein